MNLLNPNLRGFYETKSARNFVLYGGRASSKTYHTAAFCVFLACEYRIKFLCVRQFQNRISDSVKTVIEECIFKLGIQDEFNITDNGIEHRITGASFTFLGIQRNLKEIKGIAGIEVLWIEEAEDLSEEQWRILEPTIRAEHSKVFIVFNPRFSSDFVYKRFVLNPPPNTLSRHINYVENPFLSKTMLEIIESARLEDEDEYNHVYLGQPKDDDDQVIIKRSWIMASIDAHKALGFDASGSKRVGFDVADSGSDKCANVFSHGSVVSWADEWKAGEDELLKSCTRTYNAAKERGASVTYDSIGVGAGSGAKFAEINQARRDQGENFMVNYEKFNAGGVVHDPDVEYQPGITNKDMFSNIKAQAWWTLADRFRNTFNAVRRGEQFSDDQMISISSECPHLEKLIDELSTPMRDYDQNGRVKVESKKDLAKREVASPNLADAFVMCFAPGDRSLEIWAALGS